MLPATHRPALVCRLLSLLGAFACAPDPPPNVVLVTLDTTRADHLGLYGYFRDTSPQLDAFELARRLEALGYAEDVP